MAKVAEACSDQGECTEIQSNYLLGSLIAVATSSWNDTLVYATFTKGINAVYLNGVPIPGADPATFDVYLAPDGGLYAADKNHAYNEAGMVIPGVDPSTFTVLAETSGTYNGVGGYQFAKDAYHVYFPSNNTPVLGADPATFWVSPDASYATDKAHLYCVSWLDQSNYELIVAPNNDPTSCSVYQQ